MPYHMRHIPRYQHSPSGTAIDEAKEQQENGGQVGEKGGNGFMNEMVLFSHARSLNYVIEPVTILKPGL